MLIETTLDNLDINLLIKDIIEVNNLYLDPKIDLTPLNQGVNRGTDFRK